MSIIKKIWNDPVGSKVISVIVVAIMTSVYAVIKSFIDDLSVCLILESLFKTHLKVWILILAFFAGLIGYGVYVKCKKPQKFIYDQHTYENDKKLYDDMLKGLPPNGSISFLRTNNFAGFSFHTSALDELQTFYYKYSNNPLAGFFNPEMEDALQNLFSAISGFNDLISLKTFAVGKDDLQTVPPEWEYEKPELFIETVKDIHSAAQQVCDNYDNFVKLGRNGIRYYC